VAETLGTVARALSVLTVLAESKDAVGVKDIASALDLPMSTSHRLLDLLQEGGFVQKDAQRRRYTVGMEFLRLANLVTQRIPFSTAVQPVLDRITKETGETTIYAEYLPTTRAVMYSAKADSTHALRFRITLFQESPVEWGASGQAILAFLPAEVQKDVQTASRPSPLSKQRLSRTAFFERIEFVRKNGYAISEGEKLPDSIGIAVPVLLGADQIGGSITLTIPKVRFARARLAGYIDLLRKEAGAIAMARLDQRHPAAKGKAK
jgi:DNA-binding IclR family transcriptional regulator